MKLRPGILPVRRRRLSVAEDNLVADEIARQRLFAGPGRGAVQAEATTDERSVTDAIAAGPESNFRVAPRHAATATREPTRLLAAPTTEPLPDAEPVPSFEPRRPRPNAETRPIPLPVTGRPYFSGDPLDPATFVQPLTPPAIGDSMPAPVTGPPQAALFDAVPSRPLAVPYTAPGWAALQMSRWVIRGEWDDLHAELDQGVGRNAAEYRTAFRHSRETIAGQMRQRLAAIGRPDLADMVLRRTHEFNLAARATAEAGAA